MSDTHNYSLLDTDVDEDVLLDCSQLSGTDLDYEYSDRLLASDDGKSEKQPVLSNTPGVVVETQQAITGAEYKPFLQEQTGPNIKGDFPIIDSDCQSEIEDVLDLQRMADKFAEAGMSKLRNMERSVYKAGGFNYEVVTRVDKLLEEAHNMCYKYHNKLDRTTRANLFNMILALKELPHLYRSTRREKGMSTRRVTEWLTTHTDQPEPEMCDFTRSDPIQLRKFVSDIQPRISTSDTNITLGKRKRDCEDSGKDCVIGVPRSSSDTRVYMHDDWLKSYVVGKRSQLRND
ncbi:uncharacterized protein LOC128556980 isoform X2 [Mercenaria mercenaria]|uniref:uncharacterized protein LOC128556980 isoform X2 n=1 Tax=Mercenaria mercenaria TaxID=6596 RepID=UPI00234EB9D8|nr:uncharacterized protein LOC128556980 isoform X2 [Mercenaria mercenaria]